MKIVSERRMKVRPGQEKPKNLSLDEVVEKLEGLNLNWQDIIGVSAQDYEGQRVKFKNFRISAPYHEDGKAKIRIIGTYTEKLNSGIGRSIPIDYVHTFN